MAVALDPVLKNVQAIAELEREALHTRTRLDRFTDAITAAAGSLYFIVGHALWFTGWILWNTFGRAFDPFPFSLLNVLVSLEAIALTSFVLMTQNRITHQADKRAHLDLQVNLLAEQELTAMLHMLSALCQRAGVKVTIRDERVQELLQQTDIHRLAVAVEQELGDLEHTNPAGNENSRPGA